MIEVALVLALMLPAFLFAYIGLSLGEDHQVMKFFLVMMALVMAVGVPFTGYQVAVNSSDPFPLLQNIEGNTSSINNVQGLNGKSVDAFDKLIADSTTNEADLAAHYDFSPERWRLRNDSRRIFLMYGEGDQVFRQEEDYKVLQPRQGETLNLKTAEKFRYVVGYEIKPSFAYSINRSLQPGDQASVCYGDSNLENDYAGADGWCMIYTSSLQDNQVNLTEFRNGSVVDTKIVETEKPLTSWSRKAIGLNWYNVGNADYIETFTENGTQFNKVIGGTSVDEGRGPVSGNKNVRFSIKRGVGNPPIALDAGSVGVQTLGDVEGIVRTKSDNFEASIDVTNTWVPVAAVRKDPEAENVAMELTSIDILEYSANADVELLALAVSENKTDASGFEVPNIHNVDNSVFQDTLNVDTFPDENGSVVSTTANPGGYQIGYSTLTTSGQGTGNTRTASVGRVKKRSLHNSDVMVLLGYSSSTGTVDFTVTTEQDW